MKDSTDAGTFLTLAEEGELSAWARDIKTKLATASLEERKRVADRLREETAAIGECLGNVQRTLVEMVALVESHELYLELGHGSTDDWFEKDIVPILQASMNKGSVSKMRAAARGYRRLADKYDEVAPRWTVLALYESEACRQDEGDGRMSEEEFRKFEGEVAAGSMSFRDALKLTSGRGRLGPGGQSRTRRQSGKEVVAAQQPAPTAADPMAKLASIRESLDQTKGAKKGLLRSNQTEVERGVREALEAATNLEKLLEELTSQPLDAWQAIPERLLAELPEILEGVSERAGAAVAVARVAGAHTLATQESEVESLVADLETDDEDEGTEDQAA